MLFHLYIMRSTTVFSHWSVFVPDRTSPVPPSPFYLRGSPIKAPATLTGRVTVQVEEAPLKLPSHLLRRERSQMCLEIASSHHRDALASEPMLNPLSVGGVGICLRADVVF